MIIRKFCKDLVKKSQPIEITTTKSYLDTQVTKRLKISPNSQLQNVLQKNAVDVDDIIRLETTEEGMLKAELGEVNVHRDDQIPLDEVDPQNIPQDKEILLFGAKAKVYALGVPNDEDTLGTKQIFVEEHADHFSQVTWRTYAKFLFLIPVILPIAIFATVVRDYRDVASYYRTLDRENWELL